MACGVGTKMSRRLEAICVAYESLRSVGVLMVYNPFARAPKSHARGLNMLTHLTAVL